MKLRRNKPKRLSNRKICIVIVLVIKLSLPFNEEPEQNDTIQTLFSLEASDALTASSDAATNQSSTDILDYRL